MPNVGDAAKNLLMAATSDAVNCSVIYQPAMSSIFTSVISSGFGVTLSGFFRTWATTDSTAPESSRRAPMVRRMTRSSFLSTASHGAVTSAILSSRFSSVM